MNSQILYEDNHIMPTRAGGSENTRPVQPLNARVVIE